MHAVTERLVASAAEIAAGADEAEARGSVPESSAALLRSSGIMRMLQPIDYGGYEAHPCDFLDAVFTAASSGCGATGWIAGVLGLHPWEVAVMDRRAQDEVWGHDQDTWIGSPYVAQGRAQRVDGGYLLHGRWNFSSGVDHVAWVHLGGLLLDDSGEVIPGSDTHFLVPAVDYQIIEGSWDSAGLAGSGSKDVVIAEAFVPEHRALQFFTVVDGSAAQRAGRPQPLYHLPWFPLFGSTVAMSVVGIAHAVLAAGLAYQRTRVNVFGAAVTADPWVTSSIAEAASEIDASRLQLRHNIGEIFEVASRGETPTMHQRARIRRDQIRSAWRAANAADEVFARAGGNAMRRDRPIQRLWRDLHAGVNHAVNMPANSYEIAALSLMGIDPPAQALI